MADLDFSPENLRKHFHALTAKRVKIDAKLDPLRRELNELVAGTGAAAKLTLVAASKREEVVRAEIVKLQRQLAPIENERAALANALKGQTGIPEGVVFDHKL